MTATAEWSSWQAQSGVTVYILDSEDGLRVSVHRSWNDKKRWTLYVRRYEQIGETRTVVGSPTLADSDAAFETLREAQEVAEEFVALPPTETDYLVPERLKTAEANVLARILADMHRELGMYR